MATAKKEAGQVVMKEEERVGSGSEVQTAPPMAWLLVPVALLALLAFLSQH